MMPMPDQPFPRIVEVHVSGFQSHLATTLHLAPVTILVGKNDQGKSAQVRAMFAAFLNKSGGGGDFGFIRQDCANAVVEIVYDDGSRVIWTKPRKGGGSYQIVTRGAGETIEASRVGKDVPAVITDITGVRPLIVDGAKHIVQIVDQHALPFLVSGSGGVAAKLLSRVSRLDVVVRAWISGKRERDHIVDEARGKRDAAREAAWTLAFQPNYPAMLVRCEELTTRREAAESQRLVTEGVRLYAELIPVLAGRRDRIASVASAWASIDAPARVTRLEESAARVVASRGAVVAFRIATQAAATIEPRIDGWRRLSEMEERVIAVGNRMENTITLRGTVGAYATACERATDVAANCSQAEDKLRHAEAELTATLDGLDVCPVCLRPMKEAQ